MTSSHRKVCKYRIIGIKNREYRNIGMKVVKYRISERKIEMVGEKLQNKHIFRPPG